MPFKKNQPGCPCCETDGGDPCASCSGTTPSQWSVTLSGFVNSDCTKCTDLNGTFVLSQSQPSTCCWAIQTLDTICVNGQTATAIYLSVSGNTITVHVRYSVFGTGRNTYDFQGTVGSGGSMNCSSVSSQSLSFVGGGVSSACLTAVSQHPSACDVSSVSCSVTAL